MTIIGVIQAGRRSPVAGCRSAQTNRQATTDYQIPNTEYENEQINRIIPCLDANRRRRRGSAMETGARDTDDRLGHECRA